MSPEQLALQQADHRSDIFAVGAVCYEFLSYERAFAGATPDAVAAQIREGPPALNRVCPELDEHVVNIVMALETRPARRYQDVTAMQRDLESCRVRLTSASSFEAETRALTEITSTLRAGPVVEAPRRGTDREALERRRTTEVRQRIQDARAALEVGDYAAAADHAEQALVLNLSDPEARDLAERAAAALEAGSGVSIPAAQDRLGKLQTRLVDKRIWVDYAVRTGAGLIPLLLASVTRRGRNSPRLGEAARVGADCRHPAAGSRDESGDSEAEGTRSSKSRTTCCAYFLSRSGDQELLWFCVFKKWLLLIS